VEVTFLQSGKNSKRLVAPKDKGREKKTFKTGGKERLGEGDPRAQENDNV